MIRKIVGIIALIGISLFIGCEDQNQINPIEFELNSGLVIDGNGYYHIAIDTTKWQTLHRLSGHVYRDGESVNVLRFGWTSSHHWIVGDEFGYVFSSGLTDDLVYVNYDTTYITWFSGYEVPIVNGSSYSREDGEVNTMIAPVKTMVGDTATIFYAWYDDWRGEDGGGEFNIIFD